MHAARKYSHHSPRQSESHDYDFRKRAYDDEHDEIHRNVKTVDFEKRKPRRPEPVAADRVERTHARNYHTHQRDKEKRDVNDYHIHHASRAVHCDEQADVFAEIVSVHGKNDKPRHRESGRARPEQQHAVPREHHKRGGEEHFYRAEFHIRARYPFKLAARGVYGDENAYYYAQREESAETYHAFAVVPAKVLDYAERGAQTRGFHTTSYARRGACMPVFDTLRHYGRNSTQEHQKSAAAKCYTRVMNQIPPRIKLYLLKLGFQPNLKGYRLLARLIALAEEGTEIMPLKYFGYKRLAEEFGVGEASVEKDIQNAISSAWLRGDVNVLYGEFGETLDEDKGKPTNKQFLLTALERLAEEQNRLPAASEK